MSNKPLKIGTHTFGLLGRMDACKGVTAFAEVGFRRVELIVASPHLGVTNDHRTIAELGRIIETEAVEIIAIDFLSMDMNIGSLDIDAREFATARYRRLIELADALGCARIVVIPGRAHKLMKVDPASQVRTVEDSIGELALYARGHGVRICLENHPDSLIGSAADIIASIRAVGEPNVGLLYDVSNALARGEDPSAGIRAHGGDMDVLHLSDTPADAWKHDTVGSGDVDFAAVLQALRTTDFEGPAVLEIIEDDAVAETVRSRKVLEDAGWSFD